MIEKSVSPSKPPNRSKTHNDLKQKKIHHCPYEGCDKQFFESNNLKVHIRLHVKLIIK